MGDLGVLRLAHPPRGIDAGNGQMLEAPETGTPVRMASIYRRDLVGVGRVG